MLDNILSIPMYAVAFITFVQNVINVHFMFKDFPAFRFGNTIWFGFSHFNPGDTLHCSGYQCKTELTPREWCSVKADEHRAEDGDVNNDLQIPAYQFLREFN